MIKIWAKCMVRDHIKKEMIYETLDHYDPGLLYHHIASICNDLDIPTPVILTHHVENFDKFNHAIFLPRDFVESIDFDKFVLEHVITK